MNPNDFSCIKQVTKTVHLTMPLKYASNEMAGITEILDGWKRQFVPKLQGVVVNYRNIRLTSLPLFIHISRTAPQYNVTATFDVFCPSIGDIVKGKINRTSREHIGCLIEGTINATIHLSYNSSPGLSKFVHMNRDILFEITRFEFNRHNIRVNGRITQTCVDLMEKIFPTIKDDVPENMSNGFRKSALKSENNGEDSSSDTSDEGSKVFDSIKTAISNKSSIPCEPVFIKEEIETEVESDLYESSTHSLPKSKGSKKRKRDSESSSLDSPKTSKKRKKAKKSESEIKSEVPSEDSLSSNTMSKKEKKRKKKSALNNDLASHMLNVDNLISTFGAESETKCEVPFEDESLILNTPSKKKNKRKDKSAPDNDLASNLSNITDLISTLAAESEMNRDVLLEDESLTSNTLSKKKKKRKEKSPRDNDLTFDMLNEDDLISKFSAFDPGSSAYSIQELKKEIVCSTNSTVNESEGKKRKREFSSSDDSKVKKKHKSKSAKKDKKKSKDEKKLSKAKKKLLASGDIFKKDKKKSKSKKHSTEHNKKKKKNSICVPITIKPEST